MTWVARKISGITVEIGGDTTGLSKALSGVNKEIGTTQRDLKDVERLLKLDPKNTELLRQRFELLGKEVKKTEEKLDTLKTAEKQVQQQVKEGKVSIDQYNDFKREIAETEQQLDRLKEAAKASNPVLQEVGQYAKSIAEGTEKMAGALDKIKGAASIASGATIAAGAGAVKQISDIDSAVGSFIAQTGMAKEYSDYWRDAMSRIYKNNYGDDYEDISSAMAEINKQLKIVDSGEMVSLAEDAFALRDTFGYDIPESIRAVKALIQNFGITGSDAFNLIATGAQNGLDYSGELLDSISEYSVQFGKVGLDANDMFQIMQSGADAGAWNLDKVGDAIKEFSIRIIDGSDTTVGGLSAIGYSAGVSAQEINETTEEIENLEKQLQYATLEQQGFNDKTSELTRLKNADKITKYTKELEAAKSKLAALTGETDSSGKSMDELIKKFGEGGPSAKEAFLEVVSAIDQIEDPIQKNAVGVNLFGTMWEDLGENVVGELAGISEGAYSAGDALGSIKDAKYDNLQSKIETIGRDIETNIIIPIVEQLMPTIEGAVDKVSGFIEGFSEMSDEQKEMALVIAGVIVALPFLISMLSTVLTVIGTVSTGIALFTGAATSGSAAATGLSVALKGVSSICSFIAANPIVLLIAAIVGLVVLLATKGDEIQACMQRVDDFLQNIFAKDWTEVFGPVIGDSLNAFFATVKSIWDSVKKIFDGIIDFVRGVFTGDWERAWNGVKEIFSGVFGGLVSIAKIPLNGIIGAINGGISGINTMISGLNGIKVDIPDWVPGLGGKSFGFNIPEIGKIPYLAKGGILSRGSAVVGEAGPELLTVSGNSAKVEPLTNATTNNSYLGGVNMYIYGAPGQSVDELAEKISEKINNMTERDRTVFA